MNIPITRVFANMAMATKAPLVYTFTTKTRVVIDDEWGNKPVV
jgi:hypothetical protein